MEQRPTTWEALEGLAWLIIVSNVVIDHAMLAFKVGQSALVQWVSMIVPLCALEYVAGRWAIGKVRWRREIRARRQRNLERIAALGVPVGPGSGNRA